MILPVALMPKLSSSPTGAAIRRWMSLSSSVVRELSRIGLDTFRRSKVVVLDYKPSVQDWWYPYPDKWFLGSGGRKHA